MSEAPAQVTDQDPGRLQSEDVASRLAYALGRMNRLIRPERPALSHGLMLALSTAVRSGPLRPTELARVEGISAPTTTRIVLELEKRGLVERQADPDDGRSFFVVATTAGAEAVLEARHERAERAAALLAELLPAERAAVAAALPALERLSGQ